MDRQHCAECRTPIHRPAVACHATDRDLWLHADCWVAARGLLQDRYRREVAARGVEVLLAPYLAPMSGRLSAAS